MLYIAIGILGATVMPHNLYLHSSIVQTRAFGTGLRDKREALRFAYIDSNFALGIALFINAAILVLAAAAFHTRGMHDVAEIASAYKLAQPGARRQPGQHDFRLRAAGLRAKLHAHRHARRPNRDGRFSRHSPEALAAPLDYARYRHHSGGTGNRHRRRKQSHLADHPQPGGSQLSVALRGNSAGAIHQRPQKNGRFRQLAPNRKSIAWTIAAAIFFFNAELLYLTFRAACADFIWSAAITSDALFS